MNATQFDTPVHFCTRCGRGHPTTEDDDGYLLARCPERGTVIVETPGWRTDR